MWCILEGISILKVFNREIICINDFIVLYAPVHFCLFFRKQFNQTALDFHACHHPHCLQQRQLLMYPFTLYQVVVRVNNSLLFMIFVIVFYVIESTY